MKKILKYIFLTGFALLIWSCEKMNDRHDIYLKEGEIIYIGKVDSIRAFPGDERVVLRYWLGDPRAKSLTVSWLYGRDSLVYPIQPHEATDSFDIQIGRNEKTLAEGNYTFQWVTKDDKGNTSVTFENNTNVYGSRYRETITDHIVLNAEAEGDNVVITWGSNTSDQEVGITVQYNTRDGEIVTLQYPVEGLSRTVLENVDFSVRPRYQTKFLPLVTAIDTFYTDYAEIPFSAVVNVALNKPVVANHQNDWSAANQRAENAVDGNIAGDRWVATTAPNDTHWMEIDLEGEYTINGFQMWNGGTTSYNTYPMSDFEIQAWVDDEWKTAYALSNNTLGINRANFPDVTTSKVRLYTTRGGARVFELEIYSRVNY